MRDPIERQDAIDALDEQITQCDKALGSFDISMKDEYAVKVERASLKAYRETLNVLPSAQPEQRTGKWIPQDHNKRAGNISTCVYCYPICSKCGKVGIETYKYCPMCGAKMEGADDE